jgi:hypothetical protein
VLLEPLRVDERQLGEVLKAISGKRDTTFWTAERVFLIAQGLALAAWALFNYFTVTRESAHLDNALKRVTLNEEQQGRITSLVQASIKPADTKDFAIATLSVRLTNTSKAPVEISWVLLHWYLGSVDDRQKERSLPLRINEPPIDFTGEQDPGPIQWKETDYVGYVYPGSTAKKELAGLPKKFKFTDGGGATKMLLEGDSSGMDEHFLVRRVPDQWAGFVVVVGINGGTCCDRLFHYVRVISTTETTDIMQVEAKSQRTD